MEHVGNVSYLLKYNLCPVISLQQKCFYFVTLLPAAAWLDARGGTLGISGWGCAARTLEPLAHTRASFSWILLPCTRVNYWFP